jgi:hypothetical protein
MSVHIVTAANKSGGYYEILKESCIRNGCKLTTLGFGEKWTGFMFKYKQLQKFLKSVNSDDIVAFIDGFDVVMNEHIDIFIQKYKKFNKSIVLSVIYNSDTLKFIEKRMFGTVKYNGSDYFICSGLYAGRVSDLIYMFDLMNIESDKNNDDQLLLTKFIINNPEFVNEKIALDTQMELFTNATHPTCIDLILKKSDTLTISCNDGYILNNLGNRSVFIHGSGKADLKPYLKQIGYTNIPDADPYQFSGFKHISKLFVVGMFWYDWVIVFIVLIILILLIILIIKIIRYKKLKRRNKAADINKQ